MSRSRTALVVPWALTAVLVATVLWLLASPRPREHAGTVLGEATARTSNDRDLAPLRACMTRLRAAELLAVRCSGVRDADAEPRAAPAIEACLARPDARAWIDRAVAAEVTRLLDAETARRSEALANRTETVSRFLTEALSLTPEEQRWLGEYVCATRDLASSIVPDRDAGDGTTVPGFEELRLERERLLHDLEQFLGADRYGRLRSVGGIGLLADAFECQ